MAGFQEYVGGLERLAQGHDVPSPTEWRTRLAVCLDGEPGQVLRRSDESRLKQHCAYFTNATMAARLANLVPMGEVPRTYFDPTCGAGDLLLAVAKRLPIASTLTATIDEWGRCLSGRDPIRGLHPCGEGATGTIGCEAMPRASPRQTKSSSQECFPEIREGDFLARCERPHDANVVVMNPPFGYTRAPDECCWTQGRVSSAAVFAEKAIQDARAGARIVAILPDVLRAGARYHRWRSMLDVLGTTRRKVPLGIFDQWADVDVYLLDFLRGDAPPSCDSIAADQPDIKSGGVSTRFSVHVGAVVPHRHKEIGPMAPYIKARSLPAWGEQREIIEERRFSGRLFEPPFVVVRRTSRPDQKYRAVATVVLGKDPVAVENHLIVLLPKNGTGTNM